MRHPRNFPWVSLLSLCLLIGFSSSVVAQQGTLSALGGTVRDASGAVVTNAKVTLKNAGTNETRTTTTDAEGAYAFNQIVNGDYTVVIEREGFATQTFTQVAVLIGQHYALNVKLKVGMKTETVEVVAGADLIHTISPEVTATVDQTQILNLPLLGRNPIELIRNQAGVPGILAANRNTTGINGGRPGWTEVTQDGINIQDNFIRNNSLDFVPNRPTSDTIGEFSIVSNNVGADGVGGTSQVKLATPSGTNAFHGTLYEYNRNNFLSANRFFNKVQQPNTPRPFLNQNQFGGTVGGPILKDKFFFFGGYEGFRLRNGVTQSNIVPTHDSYLTGVYTYTTGPSTTATINVLNLINATRSAGLPALSVSPFVQNYVLSKIRPSAVANSTLCGDSATILLNTECFRFNQANTTNRDQGVAKLDFNLNSRHSFQGVAQRFTDYATRSDIDGTNLTPNAFIPTKARLYTGSWRWTITPNLLNEFRGGDNTVIAPFQTTYGTPPFAFGPAGGTGTLNGLLLTSPNDTFAPQGRFVTTRQYSDNATWVKGKHNVSFGVSFQSIDPHPYNFAGVYPSVAFGFSSLTVNNGYNLTAAKLPGATPTQLSAMNAYGAFLSGTMTSLSQTFQVKDLSAGYVPGFPNQRAYHFSILSPYAQDRWHVLSNLTVTAGLKWEYWSPITESKTLALLPDINGNDLKGSLLNPAGTVSPHKNFWNPDYTVFGPNVGFAWDPFKNGKTAIRGGYSLAYVNEDEVTAAANAITGNFGLVATISQPNLTASIDGGIPVVAPPVLATNRTYASQLATTAGGVQAAVFGIQPNLQTPRVHELNFSIERELPASMAIEARYVGTLGRNLWRGVDYNQQMSGNNPAYMADFNRARNNLFNCGNAAGTCAAGQPLTFLPTIVGFTANAGNVNVINDLKQNLAGDLADFFLVNPTVFTNARATFLPNPNIYAADGLVSTAVSDYHALQVELRRNMKNGLAAQVNYTFSKNLADAAGNSQSRFEPFLDNGDPSHDYGRSEFDVTHIVNANFVYELPFGRGHHWLSGANGIVDRFVGGWSTGQIIRLQSGAPFSILSGRGTFNRSARSGGETAFSTLSKDQLKDLLGLFNVNGKLYWINPAVINTDGRGVGTVAGPGASGFDPLTYTPSFAGQVFYNPQPGQFGNSQRLEFTGPASYTWDVSVAKRTKVTERIGTEFRADIFNVLNQATFFMGDTNVNSTNFGRVTSTGNTARVVQLSLRVSF